ncbi:MAG TPA: hypothetical protein DCM87_10810 [Planctomycetes bacterium]|nr:hypothetical protein [Planctomycetota bacterium]
MCAPVMPRLAVTPLTSAQPAGIGAVAVWGLEAGERMRRWFPRLAREPVVVARIEDGRAGVVDEVVAFCVPPEHAPTGREEGEIDFHGGGVARARVCAFLAARGAEEVPPESYAARALGLDGAAREALAMLPGAVTAAQAAFLLRQVRGELRREIAALRGLGDRDCARGLDALLSRARAGIALAAGIRVLVVGPVNSGKSTLVNRLCGAVRSIVSEVPGTTRDLLEAPGRIEDYPATFIDSCGLAATPNTIEALGEARLRAEIPRADCVLCLGIDPPALPARPGAALVLGPKADLGGACPAGALPVSGKTGLGIEALKAAILAVVCEGHDRSMPAPFTNRQRGLLSAAAGKLAGGDRKACDALIEEATA